MDGLEEKWVTFEAYSRTDFNFRKTLVLLMNDSHLEIDGQRVAITHVRINYPDGSAVLYDVIEPLNANGLVDFIYEHNSRFEFEPTAKYNLDYYWSSKQQWNEMWNNNKNDAGYKDNSALRHYMSAAPEYAKYMEEVGKAFEAVTATFSAVASLRYMRANGLSRGVANFRRLPCGCFTEGTLVKTREGNKEIERIQVGDWVWAYSESTKSVDLKQVLHLYKYDRDTIYKLYVSDDVIETTSEHPFFVKDKYLAAKYLVKGDSLLLQNGKQIIVDSIVIVAGDYSVYNFTVDDYHTYFVGKNGVLVHNSPCPYKLSNKRVQTEIDALGKNLSTKRLDEVDADLLKTGWTKTSDKGVTRYILEVPMENGYNKKYILDHNSTGTSHSINGQDVQYWKLYEDKASSKKVLFRGSNDTNFKGGGHGDTFINGEKIE